MKIGMRGAVRPSEEAVISVYDHGFLYGMGLFETFRTYNGGRPYLLKRHLQRLEEGCRSLGIAYRPDEAALRSLLADLMRANGLDEAYVRLTVTAGEGELGLPPADYSEPVELLMAKPLPAADPGLYETGRQLALLRTSRNTPEGELRLKSLHYMNNIIAKRELRGLGTAPGSEGLMLTKDGLLAEGIVSNLFFVAEGTVCTPSLVTGILPGITRARIIELAADAGLRVEEGLFDWSRLIQAEEIWVTNSVQELVPVTELRGLEGTALRIGDGSAGPVARKLLAAYRADIASQTGKDGQQR
ncbi:aminotransferase class IV [Paenibacillus humicola]|uniref:aminotransferase class IV n=1 Tax=Paenibacillus humicola TaxID=3110540 RepID=UPI00237A9292|nr:aminotransferase class IV [Paenibacillus humicola]